MSPEDYEGEFIGNLYVNGSKSSEGSQVVLLAFDPATANRLVEPWSGSMWADPTFSRMWEWSDPKAGGWCGDLSNYLQEDTNAREDEKHKSHPDSEPTGKESHCIRPGVYEFYLGSVTHPRKTFRVDYLPIVPAVPGVSGALQVWNQTAGVNETLEALDADDTSNVWADLVVHVDTGSSQYAETRLLSVQNAHDHPDTTFFQNEATPTGSETDYFRFSVAGSTSQWPGTSDGKALARLFWDYGRSKTEWTTNYYDPLSPDGRIIRLHRFSDHVTESRQAVVAFELMRPDEEPGDTINITQRVVQITVSPPALTDSIDGPDWISSPGTYAWNAVVSGGTPPYAYQWWYRKLGAGWQWQMVGTGTQYTRYVGYSNMGFILRLDVTDGAQGSASFWLNVSTEWGYGPIITEK